MYKFQLYNSLSRKKEEFKPISDSHVGMYTCGPTIYFYPQIGNWRTYTLSDIVVRTLRYLSYDVKYVMNLTDFGHLSGDNSGDADQGEDRMSKAAKKEGLDAREIANKYEKDFIDSFPLLNLVMPNVVCRATDHVKEQIDLIKKIEEKGYTYKISDGIYFDIQKYEADKNSYGELSNLSDHQIEGERIAPNLEKKDPRDFALWKFFATGEKRHNMEWDSPWGVGFPGWHIECSAMSMKYLGDQFDLHLGGEDLKNTHHPNEIAQSEAATGQKPFVKYWMHGAFLQVNGGRMGKSLGNAYNLHDIMDRGFSPLSLRYFYFTGKYSSKLNFTWEALESAQKSLDNVVDRISILFEENSGFSSSNLKKEVLINEHFQKFINAILDDVNMPVALAEVWELLKDNSIPSIEKLYIISEMDKILGLKLMQQAQNKEKKELEIPKEVEALIDMREQARFRKDWIESDRLRDEIAQKGYLVEDSSTGPVVKKS